VVWPDIAPTWTNVDRKPEWTAAKAATGVFKALDGLDWRSVAQLGATRDRGPGGDEEGLPYLRLSPEAHERFLDWRTALELRLRQGELDPMLESHPAKYRKLIPGLALVIHLAAAGRGEVSDVAMQRALRWAGYLETHAARVYASDAIASTEAAEAILAKVGSGHLKPEFGSREIIRAQWSKLRDRETVHAALQLLADFDWVRGTKQETAGRPATVYSINPKALAK
jgi:hypothetical protein